MIKKFWEERNTNEKVMLGFILVMAIIVALNWKKVSDGFSKGIQTKQTEEVK